MKKFFKRLAVFTSALIVGASAVPHIYNTDNVSAAGQINLEYLDRGISAINTGSGMLVSWRWLANDDDNAVFKLYRDGTLIYTSESGNATCYLDKSGSASSKYRVDAYSGGKLVSSENCRLTSDNVYFDIPLNPPTASGVTYSPNDMSVGDVDGDGQYELFLKWDPSNSKDNSQKGKTEKVYIDCIRLDGTRLWRIDLGYNIRAGAHYTQFYVADFDLDGKAEMCCKTADGTVDGTGKAIGDSSKVYRDGNGFIYTGPEYYTLFDGQTGAALDTIDYEPGRGDPTKWGKSSDKTNRVDRFWGTVAYLDGVHPCVVTGRGYYGRMTATAYTVENKKLKKLWMFDTGTSSSSLGYGDGNHNSMPADVDGDGKQEIITGSTCIDDNGSLLWCTNQGHGDAMHVGDLDPAREGIEIWTCHEDSPYGVSLISGKDGKIIFHNNGNGDTGRCCADNIWAGNPGAELWGNKESDGSTPVKDVSGNTLSCNRPAINFLIYWDGDLEREVLDGYTDSPAKIYKMNEKGKLDTLLETTGYYTCNTTKGTPCLSADIFGDWREELIVRAADSNSVRIFCTPYETESRVTTLMHDPQYRMQVSAQNTAYNQPPHTSFFLGTGYDMPARPSDCVVNSGNVVPPVKTGAVFDTSYKYTIKNANSGLFLEVADSKAENGVNVQQGESKNGWYLADAGDGYYKIISELADGKTYYLDVDYGKTDNGTNIGIWNNTNCDAQSFKFVDNGDGTYAICTKVTGDESAVGVAAASKDIGANVVQWSCNDSSDQKWIIEPVFEPISGKLIKSIDVKDTTYYSSWGIDTSLEVGDKVFGDRTVEKSAFSEVPYKYEGAELVLTPCDSKNSEKEQAELTAAEDITVFIGFDSRLTSIPSWVNGWTKETETIKTSNGITFEVYSKDIKADETITLGSNGQANGVVNYIVLAAKENISSPVIPGDINCDNCVNVFDLVMYKQCLLGTRTLEGQSLANADINGDGDRNISDLVLLQNFLSGKTKSFNNQG